MAKVRASTAPFDAAYSARWGSPTRAAIEQVLTMAAASERRRCGMRGRRHAGDPDDVDVEDARPVVVGEVLDRADGADAGVVDDDVELPELGRRRWRSRRRPTRGRGRRSGTRQDALGRPARVDVERGDAGPAGHELLDDGQPDAGPAAGHDGDEPGELLGRVHGAHRVACSKVCTARPRPVISSSTTSPALR